MFLRTALSIILVAATVTALVSVVSGSWMSAVLGGSMALFGAALGLVLLHRALLARPEGSMHRQTNLMLGAFVVAMLARLVILGASLSVTLLVLGWEPLAFIAAFFLVHLVSQVIEIRYMHRAKQTLAFIKT